MKNYENNTERILVTNIQRYSVNDGPGIRSTVFLKGCSLRCVWCHNPENISPKLDFFYNNEKCIKCGLCAEVCPQKAIKPPLKRTIKKTKFLVREHSVENRMIKSVDEVKDGETFEITFPEIDRTKCNLCLKCLEACKHGALYKTANYMTVDEIYEELKKDELFYKESNGGITISGGEPLLNPNATIEIFQKAKKDGIHTTLDTTGHAKWETLEAILKYTELVLFDVKTLDEEKHKKWTGVSNRLILENLKKIAAMKIKIRLRAVIVHDVNFWDLKHAHDIANLAKELGDSVVGIDIMPYHNFADKKYENLGLKNFFKGFPNLFSDDIMEYKKIIESAGFNNVTIGGLAKTEKDN